MSRNQDSAAEFTPRGGVPTSVTAGGAGDATEVVGTWVDRSGFMSGGFCVSGVTALNTGESITLGTVVFESADDAAGTGLAALDTGDDYTATEPAIAANAMWRVNFIGAKAFVRARFTPDMSRATLDTAALASMWLFGGSDTVPAA